MFVSNININRIKIIEHDDRKESASANDQSPMGRLAHHTGWKAGQKVGSSQSSAGAEMIAGIAQLRMTPIRMPLPRAAAPIIPATPA